METDFAIAELEAVSLGLKQKQEYLEKGIIPINLPHEIFLLEDIRALNRVVEALKKNLLG